MARCPSMVPLAGLVWLLMASLLLRPSALWGQVAAVNLAEPAIGEITPLVVADQELQYLDLLLEHLLQVDFEYLPVEG